MTEHTDTITIAIDRQQVLDFLPRCSTCAHWQPQPDGTGTCARLPLTPEPDFGCLLHEEQPGGPA